MRKPKMNIQLLKRLRTRFLRMRHPEHFNMEQVAIKTSCGTAMCIAGHALDLAGCKFKFDDAGFYEEVRRPSGTKIRTSPLRAAARVMGLNYYGVAYRLFHEFDLKTPKQAAARIQELIDSGE